MVRKLVLLGVVLGTSAFCLFLFQDQSPQHAVLLNQTPLSLLVDPRRHRAYVTTADIGGLGGGFLHAHVLVLDSTSGALLRSEPVIWEPRAIVLDQRAGRVLLANDLDGVSVLDARTGRLMGTHGSIIASPAGDVYDFAVDSNTGRGFIANQMAGTISVIDTSTGRLVRTTTLTSIANHYVTPDHVTVDSATNRVFISERVTTGTQVSMLDARTGMLLRTIPVGHAPAVDAAAPSAVVDDRDHHAFVLDSGGGRLLMLDGRTGALLRTTPVGKYAETITIDEQTDRMLVGRLLISPGIRNSVSIADARNGAVLRTIPLPTAPDRILIDQRRSTAFIITYIDSGIAPSPSMHAHLSVLDTQRGTVLRSIFLRWYPADQVVDEHTGKLFLIASEDSGTTGTLAVIDSRHTSPPKQVDLAMQPTALAMDSQAGRLLIAGYMAQQDTASSDGLRNWLRAHVPWLPVPTLSHPVGKLIILDTKKL